MIGLEFQSGDRAQAVVDYCYRRGLIVLRCGDRSVRLAPPLVVTREQADVALEILAAAIDAPAWDGGDNVE